VWKCFRRWAVGGVFERIFAALVDDPDFEYAPIAGTIVKVHRYGAGAKEGLKNQAVGRSRGGQEDVIILKIVHTITLIYIHLATDHSVWLAAERE
jgi:hypothetical protein